MAPRPQDCNPVTWAEYDGRASPSRSLNTGNLAEEDVIDDGDEGEDGDEESGRLLIPRPDRRRSSVGQRFSAMADLGGVNSFRSFARSWQRAAEFAEVIPRRPSIVYNDASERDLAGEELYYSRSAVEAATTNARSGLLSQHLEGTTLTGAPEASRSHSDGADVLQQGDDFRAREGKLLDAEMAAGALPAGSHSSRSSIFAAPHLSSPSVIGSYGSYRSSQYGTMSSGTLRPRASTIHQRRSSAAAAAAEDEGGQEDPAFGEDNPILVKEVKQGDKVVLTVDGQSTLPQSTFNAINAIIGVGMLSLPLAFRMSGWIVGIGILSLTAAVTAHTANLLARCMRHDVTLITYSDLAYVSFGTRARVVVSALFTLELLAACVALVILFADSLNLLFPDFGNATAWKCVCAVLVLILNMLPLRWLSYTSVVGIFSTICIVCVVIVDGLVKKETPGSLWEPAVTHLWPSNWLSLPLAYGLMASPWGAHSVFPSIYRDMRHPHKWGKAVQVTFSFSYLLDTCLAVIGILMFGDGIREAITSNILRTAGFPQGLTVFMCACVAVIPLTKIPLSARPLVTTADVIFGLHYDPQQQAEGGSSIDTGGRPWVRDVKRASVRVGVVLVLLSISIVFPAFDSVCAFLGAALCTLISIILPIAFYLFWDEIPRFERIISWIIIVVFAIFGLVGTACTFLPKSMVDP